MNQMSERAQKILKNIRSGIEEVQEGKLDYLMGFAEGLAAMADTRRGRPAGQEQGETGEQKAEAR